MGLRGALSGPKAGTASPPQTREIDDKSSNLMINYHLMKSSNDN